MEFDNHAKRKLNRLESKFKAIQNKHFKDTVVNGEKSELNEDHLIVAVLLILFIVISHLVLILGHIFYHEWKYFKTEIIKDFPVPCSSLSLSADEDYVTFDLNKSVLKTYIDDKGNYICSKNNLSEILHTVVERVSRIQLAQGQDKRYLACGNESLREASGYQTVFFREILKQENNSDSEAKAADDKLYWNKHPSKCYVDNSIKYDDGEVIIPEGRDYYLYASLHFNITHKNGKHQKGFRRPQRFTIRICKTIYGYEQTLVGRSELFNSTNTGDVVGSLKIETHVHLTRNDRIYVRVNDASRIIHNSKVIPRLMPIFKERIDCMAKVAFSRNPNHIEGETNTVAIRSTCKK